MRDIAGRGLLVAMVLVLCSGAGAKEADLILQYEFSEGDGATLHDTSGNGRHGRIHGGKWVRTREAAAVAFDGEDDYVECAPGAAPRLVEPLSIEMWLRPEGLPRGEGLLIGEESGKNLLHYSGGMYPARIYFCSAAVSGMSRARAPALLWHHVVAASDGTRLRIYVDGALAGGVRVWRYAPVDRGTRLLIGGGMLGMAHFRGTIGYVAVYSRCLSRDEVFRRYLSGRDGHSNAGAPGPSAEGNGLKPLNNLVTQLLDVERPPDANLLEYRFTNPRDGWVFFSAHANPSLRATVTVALRDSTEDVLATIARPDVAEAMRRLPAGPHVLVVRSTGPANIERITVRAIPELVYATYPSNPVVPGYGTYSWEFLQKDVLPNVTTIVGLPPDVELSRVREWRTRGRRWIAEHTAPWYDPTRKRACETVEDFYRCLIEKPAMSHPLMDGMVLDTHDVSHSEAYARYSDALRRIAGEQAYHGKALYFYCDCLYGATASEGFARDVLEMGHTLVWTRYLHEQPTEEMARSFVEAQLADEIAAWERAVPGCTGRMILALGYLTSPGERMDVEPGAYYPVLMDMQCNLLANHPAFRRLAGVMWYKSPYATDVAVKWAGRLFRHYFIEGNRDLLSKDHYELRHVRNPDFERGAEGWTLLPAEEGSLEVRHLERYGFAQGRWLETGAGDTFIVMRRSALKPNSLSQEILNLEPGRLYSIEFYTADYQALLEGKTKAEKHAVSVLLDNAEVLDERSFQHPYPNFSYYHLGPYDDAEATTRTWQNYHRTLFRPTGATVRLTISDWFSPDQPGGPIGQEISLNFVQIQPHIE